MRTARRLGLPFSVIWEAEKIYKDNSQLRIEDFVFPYGKLDGENDWVKLAGLVPWETVEERYAARFVNNGHPAYPCRMALGHC